MICLQYRVSLQNSHIYTIGLCVYTCSDLNLMFFFYVNIFYHIQEEILYLFLLIFKYMPSDIAEVCEMTTELQIRKLKLK